MGLVISPDTPATVAILSALLKISAQSISDRKRVKLLRVEQEVRESGQFSL